MVPSLMNQAEQDNIRSGGNNKKVPSTIWDLIGMIQKNYKFLKANYDQF